MFSLKLKELREKAGFSQQALAAKMGISQSTVGMWESGKREPNFATTQQIANFFNVSVDYLLGQTNFPAPAAKKITPHEFIKELVAEYGEGADTALNLFAQLDAIDRGRIIGNMEVLLTDSKYSAKEELNNA